MTGSNTQHMTGGKVAERILDSPPQHKLTRWSEMQQFSFWIASHPPTIHVQYMEIELFKHLIIDFFSLGMRCNLLRGERVKIFNCFHIPPPTTLLELIGHRNGKYSKHFLIQVHQWQIEGLKKSLPLPFPKN